MPRIASRRVAHASGGAEEHRAQTAADETAAFLFGIFDGFRSERKRMRVFEFSVGEGERTRRNKRSCAFEKAVSQERKK